MRDVKADEHIDVLGKLCLQVGRCLRVDGRIRDAVDWLEESRDLQTGLSEDHSDRLLTQHVLAIAYQANGQIKDAVRLLEQVVAIRERVLAEDHPDRLTSQAVLASAYQDNGQVKDTVRLLEHVVAIRERVLAEDHPDRLASQYELACAYMTERQRDQLESQSACQADGHEVTSLDVTRLTVDAEETTPHRSQKSGAYICGKSSQETGETEGARGNIRKLWQKLKKRVP
jgi:tetratricopeptide (TPR) repeat protein